MLVFEVYLYVNGPSNFKRAQLVPKFYNWVVLIILLIVVNGVIYMTNGTMTWLFFFLMMWHFLLQNKFTQTIFTTQYQIKKY